MMTMRIRIMSGKQRLIEDDVDAGYCPFCGVFVDGDIDYHWCPALEDDETDDFQEDDIDYDDED
jgi:hypothetical protein